MRNVVAYMLVFAILLLSGCAAKDSRVQSITPASYGLSSGPGAAGQVKIAMGELKVQTGKSDRLIGEAKTGGFNSLTPIRTEQTVDGIVKAALENGLREMGLQIVNPADASYRIDGVIEKFWVDEYATGRSFEYARASVKYDVYVRNAGGDVVWANTIDRFKTSGKSMDATADNIPLLTETLAESVRALAEDTGFWKAISQ